MVGENIKKYRQERGLSLSELARIADISKSYLYQLENGESKTPSVKKIANIAGALGVPIDNLMDMNLSYSNKNKKQPLPPSLEKAVENFPEMKQYTDMLVGIKMRGKYPKTDEDWYALYMMIKNTIRP